MFLIEAWRKISSPFPWINHHYEVSFRGEVRNTETGKEVKSSLSHNRNGEYLKVDIWYNGKRNIKRIHRLVAEAFIPNPEGKPEVNHNDCNPLNCQASNLSWMTRQENEDFKHFCETT